VVLTLDFRILVFPIAWASGRAIKLSARCSTVEAKIIAEVPFTEDTMTNAITSPDVGIIGPHFKIDVVYWYLIQ
jgi:hypothetical protein